MIGRQLQQYLIVDKAGEGGMGVVWRARDIRLDRDVALKVLPERFADQLGRDRFVREAKSASGLNHPNIVTIYEIDSDAGVDFIAMEFIRGVTLFERLNQSALTIAEAIDVATHVADALACAHEAGIVHRDLKPGNIMIALNGTVKVLDFGLAKSGAPQSEPDIAQTPTFAPLTAAGSTVGTPDYMSPEQAVGDPVDKRSDVFSFGVVLYQMLTRTLPFHGSSRSERLRQLHLATPPPIAGLRPEVPPGLIAIVAKALEKNPADRYASMSDVRQALAHLDRTAVAAPPRVATPVRLPRARAIVMAVALAIGLGGGVWVWSRRAEPAPAASNVAERAPVGSAFDLTQQAMQLLTRHDRVENVDRAIRLLEQALTLDQNYAPAHAALSDAYRRKNAANPDPQWSRLSAESARRALELNPDLAIAHTAQGFVDFDGGRLADAEARWKKAIEIEPNAAMPHLGLGMAYGVQKRDAEAETSLKEAARLNASDWRLPSELGTFYYRRSRYAESATWFDAAKTQAPDNAIVWRNLGGAYFQLERYEDAASAFQRSLEITPSAAVYTNLGTLRFFQGRYHDAVTAFEKAVELGANRSLYWGNLGDGLRWAPGRRADSIAAYERAIALLREEVARQPAAIDLRSRLGTYLAKSNQTAAALEAIKDIERQPALTAQVQMHLTLIHELAGHRDQALARLAQAVKAGYSVKEIANEPELTQLRADARYHRLVGALPAR